MQNISLLFVGNGPNFNAIIESLVPGEKGFIVKRQEGKGMCFTKNIFFPSILK